MITVKVYTEGGNWWVTGFNGTEADAVAYFVGRVFNVGRGELDYMERVARIEVLS